jgi:hypothetical protein
MKGLRFSSRSVIPSIKEIILWFSFVNEAIFSLKKEDIPA